MPGVSTEVSRPLRILLTVDDVQDVSRLAQSLEVDGADGLLTTETKSDAFIKATIAIEASQTISIGTGLALAFARNPMSVAVAANDLTTLSHGRFVLGLGSQIKAHVQHRYSMPWSRPAQRLEEFILAIRAIWDCWETGGPLSFQGEFYQHTLMNDFFSPGPNDFGNPPILLGAVGPLMTAAATKVADGVLLHALSSASYTREVAVPDITRLLETDGRRRSDFTIQGATFAAVVSDEQGLRAAQDRLRERIAFYASTPAYRGALEHHGWGDAQEELRRLVRDERWGEMPQVIDDGMLNTLAAIGTPDEVGEMLRNRFAGVVDAVTLAQPSTPLPPRAWAALRRSV